MKLSKLAAVALVLVPAFPVAALSPAEIFKKASSSVVIVEVRKEGSIVAKGSAVAIAPTRAITNCHVLEKGTHYTVEQTGRRGNAKLILADSQRDLCMLEIAGLQLNAAKLQGISSVKTGDRAYAIGAPLGLELTLSEGIVSGLRARGGSMVIQNTAAISPGSSGGGLFNESGHLIGITTFSIDAGQNVNFALPSDWILEIPARGKKTLATTDKKSITSRAVPADPKKGSPQQEIADARMAVEVGGPQLAWNLRILGEALHKTGQFEEGTRAYERASQIEPNNEKGWQSLAKGYYRHAVSRAPPILSLLRDAESATRRAIKEDNRQEPNEDEHGFLGLIFLRRGEFASAEREFLIAAENPTQPGVKLFLALTRWLQGNRASAAALVTEVTSARGADFRDLFNLLREHDPWLVDQLQKAFPSLR